MNDNINRLLKVYRGKGLLLDANLLLLLIVGYFDAALVGDSRYKKLAKYTQEDLDILIRFECLFKIQVTTPHVLTEVSNLVGDLPEATKQRCFRVFNGRLNAYIERHVPSSTLFARREFAFLGLTDTALTELSSEYLIVSDDARMVNLLGDSGIEALNFNHLREHLNR